MNTIPKLASRSINPLTTILVVALMTAGGLKSTLTAQSSNETIDKSERGYEPIPDTYYGLIAESLLHSLEQKGIYKQKIVQTYDGIEKKYSIDRSSYILKNTGYDVMIVVRYNTSTRKKDEKIIMFYLALDGSIAFAMSPNPEIINHGISGTASRRIFEGLFDSELAKVLDLHIHQTEIAQRK